MNCPNCNADVPSGARFCSGCGTSLAGVCRACGTSNQADARFCSQCGGKLQGEAEGSVPTTSDAENLPYAERRQLTVLFSDLVGSTSLSEELDPEDLRTILRDYQVACSTIVPLYGGHLAKYLGDGVLAYFGYPTAHEDDAVRGVRAGLGIIEAIEGLREEHLRKIGVAVDVRVGVHTGVVVVGDMDRSDALESDAIVGQTPNMAARIQSLAEPNQLWISGDTWRIIEGYFEGRDLGEQELKGISRPVQLWQVIHESTARTRLEAGAAHLIPFTGREKEVRLVMERWEKAREGEQGVVLIGGEPGVGKSRYVMALRDRIGLDPEAWLTQLRCSASHQNSSLYPAIDFLERVVLEFDRDESPEERLTKVEGFVSRYGIDHEEGVALLASLLSIPRGEDEVPLNVTPQKQKEMTIDLLITILLKRSERQPLLFVLEDLHWADPSTLEMLDRLLERIENRRILILLTYRPAFHPYWPPSDAILRVDLTGLPQREGEEIIRKAADGKRLPREVVDYILTKTDGVPLFLEELTRSLVESEVLQEKEGGYELTAPLTSVSVPTTLQDSLTARLDRLGEAKPLAQLGATLGREFSFGMIGAIPGPHHNDLGHRLDRLVESGILFRKGTPPDATYLFRHALFQDAAYNSLLKSTRRTYHGQIADVLEQRYPEVVETQPEVMAHHATEAEQHVRGVDWWLKAGMRALQRSANIEAIAHLDRGLEVVGKIPEEEGRDAFELGLLTMKGTALIAIRGFGADEVGKCFDRAGELCDLLGETPQLFPSLWGQWVYNLVRDELEESRDIAERMVRMGRETGESRMLIEGLWTLGDSLFWLGDLDGARENLEKGVALYDPEQHHINAYYYGQDPGVAARCYLHYTLLHLGDFERLEQVEKEMVAMADTLRHPFTKGWALSFLMMRSTWSGDAEAALPRAIETISFCTRQSYPFWLFAGILVQGWSSAVTGNLEEGLATIEQGLEGWDATGSIICKGIFLGLHAEVLNLAGRHDEALAVVDDGIALTRKHSEVMSEIDLHRYRGESLYHLGRNEEGREAIAEGLSLARKHGSRLLELRALDTLLRLPTDGEERSVEDRSVEERRLEEIRAFFPKDSGVPAASDDRNVTVGGGES